jgi:hypothetical protein
MLTGPCAVPFSRRSFRSHKRKGQLPGTAEKTAVHPKPRGARRITVARILDAMAKARLAYLAAEALRLPQLAGDAEH